MLYYTLLSCGFIRIPVVPPLKTSLVKEERAQWSIILLTVKVKEYFRFTKHQFAYFANLIKIYCPNDIVVWECCLLGDISFLFQCTRHVCYVAYLRFDRSKSSQSKRNYWCARIWCARTWYVAPWKPLIRSSIIQVCCLY